jgi:hypothetical protein
VTEDRVVQRCIRRSIPALALLLFPLVGCEPKKFWLELPTFGSGAIDGVWLWRLSEATDSYERTCRLTLYDPEAVNGREQLRYRQDCDAWDAGFELSAALERDPNNPDAVTLGIWYLRHEDPGLYKVSSYGEQGESALSETALGL